MKYSDDLMDINNNLPLASVVGVLCAITSAVATVNNAEAAYIFFAILIGNLLALKVDGIHHVITLIVFAIISIAIGVPELNLVILLICILAALSDEIGHEMISKITDNKFLNLFFEYRFVMKVVIFALAICGVFSIWIFVCFLLFELSYVIAEMIFEKVN